MVVMSVYISEGAVSIPVLKGDYMIVPWLNWGDKVSSRDQRPRSVAGS